MTGAFAGQVYLPVRLPMYDWPEVRSATRSLESAFQSALVSEFGFDTRQVAALPEDLDLEAFWADSDVLLTQTCGYPLTHALAGKVRLVGTPQYAAEGCKGANYSSQIVVAAGSAFERLEDLRGARAVFNGRDSQSGMNAFRHAVAQVAGGKRFFKDVSVSGAHLASARAVAGGDADVACIDAVCWGLIRDELPDLAAGLRSIAQTASVPGLPLITSLRFSDNDADRMAAVVAKVLASPETQESRERLGIRGFSRTSPSDYAGILQMEAEAASLGYPVLA